MVKTFLFVLIFCSLNIFSQTPDQKELCGSIPYNYNHHFGPERNEQNVGISYSYSVADLLSEDLYLRTIGTVPNSSFDDNISAIDIQRCDAEQSYGLGSGLFADDAFFAMDCALYEGGACLEKYATSSTRPVMSITRQKGRFEYFMSIFNDWLDIKTDRNKSNEYIAEKSLDFWKYLPKDEKNEFSGSGYSAIHFYNAFHNAKNGIHFLNLLLITDDCKNKRFQFSNRELAFINFYKRPYSSVSTYKEKMDIIKKVLSHKRSLMVTLLDESEAMSYFIISGLRMNGRTCEMYIRSAIPWSSPYPLWWHSGWNDVNNVLSETLSLRYLKEVKPADYEKAKEAFSQKVKDLGKIYKEINTSHEAW
jgi:hypothetical protein